MNTQTEFDSESPTQACPCGCRGDTAMNEAFESGLAGEIRPARRSPPRPASARAPRAGPRSGSSQPKPTPRPRPFPPRRGGGYLRAAYPVAYPYEPEPSQEPSSKYNRWVHDCLNRIFGLSLPVIGYLDAASRSAIRRLQRQEGLLVTGVVSPATEQALRRLCGEGGEPPDPISPGEWGESEWEWEGEVSRSSREYISWVQQSLNKIAGFGLSVDGISGPATRSAVRSFQQQKGLTADGIVGPITEAALIAAGASAPPSDGVTPGSGTNRNVNTPLPLEGTGFYAYEPSNRSIGTHHYGLPETIRAIQAIGAAWQQRYPQGPQLGIGHISLRGGGDTPHHKGHESGLEVDVRPVRNDGLKAGVTYTDPAYSRPRTQELITLILANGVLKVDRILFNDSRVTPVRPATGHDDHLHVYFSPPVTQPATGLSSYIPSRTDGGTAPLAWGAKVSPAFRARVRQIGAELGINPNFLMAVMAFETNETFDPSIRNPYSGATGLIQFTHTTAGKLGTSADALARMSGEQQLDYVARYFSPYRGQLKTIEDVYMAVLYGPGAVGVPNATVLFSTPSREYEWNKALDSNHDGRITKAEAAAPVIARLNKGLQGGLQGELKFLSFRPEPFLWHTESQWEDEASRTGPEYIRWVQSSLNRVMGLRLAVDGIIGTMTRSAIRSFQSQKGLGVDGIVGPITEAALLKAGATPPPGSAAPGIVVPQPIPWGPPSSTSSLRNAIVQTTLQERQRWRNGALKERDEAAFNILVDYWKNVGLSDSDARSYVDRDVAWSAAFISWVMVKSGALPHFTPSTYHSTYIAAAYQNQLQQSRNPIKAYTVRQAAPRPGDLVCTTYPSETGSPPADLPLVRPQTAGYHCDIVVQASPDQLTAMGGNLGDTGMGTVGMKTLSIDPKNGLVTQPGSFAVIRVG